MGKKRNRRTKHFQQIRPMRARVHSRCAKTGKQRYYNELEAMIALQSTFQSDRVKRAEKRCYRCPFCLGWHLTSQELRPHPAAEPAAELTPTG